ncbi:outer membrane beta-barrel protein [Emticicia sp. 17c]|uniref:outer membrane beta-barrel protein n=1 Tax=Emticicia sp. 17c TaxID=3127704 RepID=UPI00301B6F78
MKTLVKTIAALSIAMAVNFGAKAQDEDHFGTSKDKEYNNEDNYEHYERKDGKRNMFSRRDFGLYLGLNTYETQNLPELDNFNSRFIALSWKKNHRLITGNNVDVAMGTGFEFAWNNYMFKDNITLASKAVGTDFVEVKESLEKSKLVVTNFNIPVMLQFGFKESKWILGLGAYGGARIDSYTKTKGENGTKRDHGAFNMSKFHYGFAAEIGRKNFTLFARYQMTPIFKDNNGVNGNAIMFGIRL